MKTKIDFVKSHVDTFKNDLQSAVDAIELNVNNKIIDIKYNTFDTMMTALIIYTVKDNERQLLNESDGLDGVIALDD